MLSKYVSGKTRLYLWKQERPPKKNLLHRPNQARPTQTGQVGAFNKKFSSPAGLSGLLSPTKDLNK